MEGGLGPELTIYSARYASPPPRLRPAHPTHTHHHVHDYGTPPRHPGVPSGGSLLGMVSGPFSGPLSLPQGSGYWGTAPGLRGHHHHHHTFPPYPPLPPPPPRRLHLHPHGHQSMPLMGLREPMPTPPPAGRWDEDPCFLRPHSPDTPCPHKPGTSSSQQEDGTCFVVMGSREPSETSHTFAAKNPFVIRQQRRQQQQQQQRQQQEEDGVYSYAGEGILCPADVIRAQAAMDDSDSYGGSLASENIYEEIPETWRGTWSRRSLVEEVLDEYERVRAGHRRVLSALNLDVETLIRPSGQDGTASPDSGLTVSASDSSCEPNPLNYDMPRPRSPTNRRESCFGRFSQSSSSTQKDRETKTEKSPKNKGRLVKCESLDLKEAMMRRPSGGRGRGFKERLGGVREKIEKRGWRFPNFSRKGMRHWPSVGLLGLR
ncbi:uncharacterized protein LOC121854542 [Homarus americanus]|uniref:uncharacterized protein LOC121854542 n=1 Tax=Homarus americanus TaxID=6706 RepID=UPI001C47D35D|nr:uncharacterized protein LOC121854542 [Homarus americanus]